MNGVDDDWDNIVSMQDIEPVADGSLGWAAYQMTQAFGLEVPDEYDLTCQGVGPWPRPEDDTYVPLFMKLGDSGVAVVGYHTPYNLLIEGDAKRFYLDSDPSAASTSLLDRRTGAEYDGISCMYWDNISGDRP